jgi:hypothetical protein
MLKRVLHSLACGKYKILEKEPKSTKINPTDSFRASQKFSCPMKKVREKTTPAFFAVRIRPTCSRCLPNFAKFPPPLILVDVIP